MSTPKITRIIYREYAGDLFGNQDTTGIDVSASAARFLAQLSATLLEEYQGIRVVTELTAQPIQHERRVVVETKPINDDDGAALRLSEETAFDVQQIASDVYERGDWYVETTP